MDLRSLLQDILREVSSEVISFQIELHSLITWVRSSDLFLNYRIFEDMHHGITDVACCMAILQNFSMHASKVSYVFQKFRIHALMQHGKFSGVFD